MEVGDYVRTEDGIDKVEGYRYEPEYENGHVIWFEKSDSGWRYTDKDLPKSSSNILDLIEPMDLLYIDIEYGYEGGIVVPRICETQAELDEEIKRIKNDKERKLVGVITHEQIESIEYKIGE